MMKSGLACCVFTMAVLVTQAAQNQPNADENKPVTLSGAAAHRQRYRLCLAGYADGRDQDG